MSNLCFRVDLGRRDYRETWALQAELVARRQAGKIPDVILFVEHPSTYTLGRAGKREHLLVDEKVLKESGQEEAVRERARVLHAMRSTRKPGPGSLHMGRSSSRMATVDRRQRQ